MSFSEQDGFAAQEKAAFHAQQLRAYPPSTPYPEADNAAQPFTACLAQRLQVLSSLIEDTHGSLCSHRDRNMGATPRGVSGGKGAGPQAPAGAFNEILGAVDAMIGVAQSMRDEAQIINNRT